MTRKYDFKSIGENVIISERASIYGADKISLGNNVRIDDFAVISASEGEFIIGDYVHVACHASLIGAGKITIGNHVNLSGGVRIYSSSDYYEGGKWSSPMLPKEKREVYSADVVIENFCVIGANSVMLPGATLKENSSVGALSLVKGFCGSNGIFAGTPAKFIKRRFMSPEIK